VGLVVLLWVENLGVELRCSPYAAVFLVSKYLAAGFREIVRNIAVDDLCQRDVSALRHEVKTLRLYARRRQVVPFQIVLRELSVRSHLGLLGYSLYRGRSVDRFLSAGHIGQPMPQILRDFSHSVDLEGTYVCFAQFIILKESIGGIIRCLGSADVEVVCWTLHKNEEWNI
jgi:hypothetical protein